jgi:Mg-chelatase subunit ChlI
MNEQAQNIHEIIKSLADQFDMNKTTPPKQEEVVEHDIDIIEDAMDFEEIIADTYIYIWKRVEDELYHHVKEPTTEMINAIAELFVVEKTPRSFDEMFEGTKDQLDSLKIST